MYWCYNCEKNFEYPIVQRTTQARLFGVETMPTDEKIEVLLCPFCKSDEITKEVENEED